MVRNFVRSIVLAGGMSLGFLGLGSQAQAGITISAAVGGVPTGVNYENFDGLSLGNAGGLSGSINVSFTGSGQAVQGAEASVYAPPYLSNANGTLFGDPNDGPDATTYLSTGTGTVTLDLPDQMKYIGLLWGSVDNYNTLDLYNGATLIASITGSDVTASANGNQGINGTYYVNINSTDSFNRVVARSSSNAFEFDNVAYSTSAVPEPSTMTLFGIATVGMIGFARRKTKRAS